MFTAINENFVNTAQSHVTYVIRHLKSWTHKILRMRKNNVGSIRSVNPDLGEFYLRWLQNRVLYIRKLKSTPLMFNYLNWKLSFNCKQTKYILNRNKVTLEFKEN